MGVSSCGTWAGQPHGMWDLPGPGIEPVAPASVGGFFTTELPGKPQELLVYALPTQETKATQVRSLGQEDLLEEGTADHSSILPWRIPWTEEPGGLQFTGSERVGHD